MKHLLALIVMVLASLASPAHAGGDPLDGAWSLQELHWIREKGSTSIIPAQPGLLVIADRHYSLSWTTTASPRTPFVQLAQPTDAEIKAAYQSIAFNAGSFERAETALTTTSLIARVPGFEGGRQVFACELQGERLTLTMHDETYPDGSKPAWHGKLKIRMVFKRLR